MILAGSLRGMKLDRKMLKLYYRTNIEESLEEKPNLTYGELLEIYGTPKEIADSYIESLDPEEYAEDIRRIKRKKWMFGIVFFSVIAFAIVYLLHITIVGCQTRPVSYTDTIEIIEETAIGNVTAKRKVDGIVLNTIRREIKLKCSASGAIS